MLTLALPVLAEETLNLLVGYTNWFLAGRFLPGDDPKAAMGLIAYVLWMLPNFFSLVSIGTLAVVARLVGARQLPDAAHIARQALWLGSLVALAAMLLAWSLGSAFVAAMQLEGTAAQLATRYIHFLVPAMPLVMLEQVGTACLRGAGDTVSGLVARVAVNLVNAVLSAALVTGIGPFPELGFTGLAVGTLAGHCCGGLIIAYRWTRWNRSVQNRHVLNFDTAAMRRILRIGVPGGIDVWTVLVCHLVYAAIINSLGTLAQAAHGLGLQIEALSYLPGSAFSVAAATLAGQSLGAMDQRRAFRGVLFCTAAALAIMSAAGVVLFFGGEAIGSFFLGSRSETAILVGRLLKVVSISCPFLAVLSVVVGALRGAGDTRFTLVVTLLGLVGLRIPAACLLAWDQVPLPLVDVVLPAAGMGVIGAWWAMVADVTLRSLLVAARFVQGAWQKIRV
jgi:putative MATE family efflux protein